VVPSVFDPIWATAFLIPENRQVWAPIFRLAVMDVSKISWFGLVSFPEDQNLMVRCCSANPNLS